MARYFRYLRIAFSATCLITCVLLIVLWVRSYWWEDNASIWISGRGLISGISVSHLQLQKGFEHVVRK